MECVVEDVEGLLGMAFVVELGGAGEGGVGEFDVEAVEDALGSFVGIMPEELLEVIDGDGAFIAFEGLVEGLAVEGGEGIAECGLGLGVGAVVECLPVCVGGVLVVALL